MHVHLQKLRRRRTASLRHSNWPPWVGTVPGPLPMAPAASLGPDQGGGPRRAAPTSPEGRKSTSRRRTDVGCGGGQLWGRDEDESEEVPSTIRRRLTFTRQKRQLARAWRHLESQAAAILPKTVRERALALLRWLLEGGYISWRPDTLELIVDGIEHKGTNLMT